MKMFKMVGIFSLSIQAKIYGIKFNYSVGILKCEELREEFTGDEKNK